MLDSNAKGTIAEQALILAAMKLHVRVWKPVNEHDRCDLAFDVGRKLWRVQCKWGRLGDAGTSLWFISVDLGARLRAT